MEILKGADGHYIIKEGKLLKIVEVYYSPDWFRNTAGYAIYTLADGTSIRLG